MNPTRSAEDLVLLRARLRIGSLVGLVLAALLALAGGISYAVLLRGQEAQIQRELDWGVTYGAIEGPPGCSWIIRYADSRVDTGSYPPPDGFPLRADLDAVAATGVSRSTSVAQDGTRYYVLTVRHEDGVVQAVFDARFQLADRRHLLMAFLLAALAGALAAVVTGVVVGRRAVAPLAEALRRQRRFVADASHELRTPIAQVHARAQVLQRRARRSAAPGDDQDLERLVTTTRRLGEIVDELLLSARLAAVPTDPPSAARVDLSALAHDAAAAETDRAAAKGVAVSVVTHGPAIVPGVESALRRVVGELLSNALTHTRPGGRIVVGVAPVAQGRAAEVVVQDDGAGFDPADAERLFDRFHRGDGADERRYGLGLALLREVVTSHGGTITAASTHGEGATFTVRLPVSRERPAPGARSRRDHRRRHVRRPHDAGRQVVGSPVEPTA